MKHHLEMIRHGVCLAICLCLMSPASHTAVAESQRQEALSPQAPAEMPAFLADFLQQIQQHTQEIDKLIAQQPADTPPAVADLLTKMKQLMQEAAKLPEVGVDQTLLSRYVEVVDSLAKLMPLDHPSAGFMAYIQGYELTLQGKYAEARLALERAEKIWEKSPQTVVNTALTQALIARLHTLQGDEDTARSLYKSSIERLKHSSGTGPLLSQMLSLVLQIGDGQFSEAQTQVNELQKNIPEALQNQASHDLLQVMEKGFGLIAKLAGGDPASAWPSLQQLAEIPANYARWILPDFASLFQDIADGHVVPGDAASQYTFFKRGLQALENVLGPVHPDLVPELNSLAALDLQLQQPQRARERVRRAGQIVSQHMANFLSTLSFAEQRAFLDGDVRRQTSMLLSYHQSNDVLPIAYELLFHWKGLLIESLRQHTALSQRYARSPKHWPQIAQLQGVRSRLAGWFHKARDIPYDHWQTRNDELTREKEALERELVRLLPKDVLEDPLQNRKVKFLQALLAPDEIFLDVYRYRDERPGEASEMRYGVVIVGPDIQPQMIPLGTAHAVELALRQWRQPLLRKKSVDAAWHRLAELVWQPIAAHLPETARKIWLSPDAELARLPWHLLPSNASDKLERQLTQIDSARAFARLRQPHMRDITPPSLLLAGGIDFNAGGSAPVGMQPQKPYPFLAGTVAEVTQLDELARRHDLAVTVLRDDKAHKTAITKRLPKATYVHLATHGFFYQKRQSEQPTQIAATGQVDLANYRVKSGRNPLVESGIVLAGANLRTGERTNAPGLLTAEELVGMDLHRTKLVVLSACETGRGEAITGQGVIGLRASVMAAGARSMIMSLWKVPDDATQLFMKAFYEQLWGSNTSVAKALHLAAQTVRNEPKFSHPLYWAAWILAGEGW